MAHASRPPQTSRDRLAEARVRFLAAEAVDQSVVRKPILASWRRSHHAHVAADHIDLSYLQEPDLETTLARAADPVLRRLREQLDGQPISIILTDADGLVLARLTADHDLERALDSVMLAPGFSYSEARVGTNGIGTALEAGGRADPRSGLGQDRRRHRPDLLAQGRRPADDLPGQGHRRPDHPGAGDGQ